MFFSPGIGSSSSSCQTCVQDLQRLVGVENILPLYVTVETAWSCARFVNETPYARARMFVRVLFLHSALKALSNPSFFAFLAVLLLVCSIVLSYYSSGCFYGSDMDYLWKL